MREIRNARNVPMIAISEHAQPWDRLRALELGIDEYIMKPFLIGELLIRIRRALTRHSPKALQKGSPSGFTFSRFHLDPIRRTVVTLDGAALDLTETEFNILNLLVQSHGRVMSRDELWLELRGQAWSPVDRALDVHIARLRQKLEPEGGRQTLIKSVRGLGYVLSVAVS